MNESLEESIDRILKGAFSIRDEEKIIENIRTKLNLPLNYEKIIEILMDCEDDGLRVEESKNALISAWKIL